MTHSTSKLDICKWDKFWRWTVLLEVPKAKREVYTKRQFKCKCECWTIREVNLNILTRWESQSCWCLHKQIVGNNSRTHWMHNTKIYKVFSSMKKRCNTPTDQSYKNYGWRWIKCLWNTFEEFYVDMWPTYRQWLTIDRIDNNWNYCRENCRWTDRRTQANNTRNVHNITHNWETHSIAEWARILNKNVSTLRVRIHRWKSIFNS